jgi:RNA polymerase sigma-70 factor, ECF subfamily
MINHMSSDEILIKNYIAGNDNALQILIKRHKSRIYGFIYTKIKDKDIADDIFQDTFIKVIKALRSESYEDTGKFLSWILRITNNLIMDHFRKNRHKPISIDDENTYAFSNIRDHALTIESTIIKIEIEKDLVKKIDKLCGEQKEVVLMRMYQDMGFKEISEETGVSINTALGRMRYALINLRKILD